MTLRYPTSGMVFRSKNQRSRSQGHKVEKDIEGDRVAGVSLHLYRVPTVYNYIMLHTFLSSIIEKSNISKRLHIIESKQKCVSINKYNIKIKTTVSHFIPSTSRPNSTA